MKKRILLILAVLCLMLVACGSNRIVAYFPDSEEMKVNLEKAGYTVNVSDEFYEEYKGTYLVANKGEDYIEFYWLDETDAIEDIKQLLKEKHHYFDRLESRGADKTYGTHVFCGTNKAFESSGIVF